MEVCNATITIFLNNSRQVKESGRERRKTQEEESELYEQFASVCRRKDVVSMCSI